MKGCWRKDIGQLQASVTAGETAFGGVSPGWYPERAFKSRGFDSLRPRLYIIWVLMEWKFTEENPLRVFTTFSGYDSQLMAVRNLGIPYECIGWCEIDPYAIKAHDAIFPELKDKNYGDITQINWEDVPDFDFLTYSSPCQDFSNAGLQMGGRVIWPGGLAPTVMAGTHGYGFGCILTYEDVEEGDQH